jgi:hypothetical protein
LEIGDSRLRLGAAIISRKIAAMADSRHQRFRLRHWAPYVLGLGAAGAFAGAALAGEGFVPKQSAPDQTRCKALGDGFFAVRGSDACVKISGYVASGVDFVGPFHGGRNFGPFGARASSGAESSAGVSAEAHFDTPMGQGRLYIEMGRDSFHR